jgi:alpha,alpha-trehalose phosphorylase
VLFGYRTTNSRMTLGVGVDHVLETDNPWRANRTTTDDLGKVVFTVDARAGVPIRITKYFTYHTRATSPRRSSSTAAGAPSTAPCGRLRRPRSGQRALPRRVLGARRRPGRGPGGASSRRSAGTSSSSPRRRRAPRAPASRPRADRSGLRGPLLLGHRGLRPAVPDLHRAADRPQPAALPHSMLPLARERARELSEDAARCSRGARSTARRPPPTTPAGTAQYHIDADIAYAIKRYVDVRGDVATCCRGRRGDPGRDRPHAVGTSASSAPTTALPHPRRDRDPTSTRPSSTTTPSPT